MTDFYKLKCKLYADSPFTLGTEEDDAYRNGIDNAIEAFKDALYPQEALRRWNCYEELLEACKLALARLNDIARLGYIGKSERHRKLLTEAINKAEEE